MSEPCSLLESGKVECGIFLVYFFLCGRPCHKILKMKGYFHYYVVQNNEIVGSYRDDLNSACKHIQLYGRKQCLPNRALIPIPVNAHKHTMSRVEQMFLAQIQDFCFWEKDAILVSMKECARKYHDILFPPFIYDFSPMIVNDDDDGCREKKFSMLLRKDCIGYFEDLYQMILSSNKSSR